MRTLWIALIAVLIASVNGAAQPLPRGFVGVGVVADNDRKSWFRVFRVLRGRT